MENLENLNFVELKADELKEVDGGFWSYVIGGLIGALMSQDLDAMGDEYSDGYAAAQN